LVVFILLTYLCGRGSQLQTITLTLSERLGVFVGGALSKVFWENMTAQQSLGIFEAQEFVRLSDQHPDIVFKLWTVGTSVTDSAFDLPHTSHGN
jgi:hypothetical protein